MSLQSQLAALISQLGIDWKALWDKVGTAALTTTATTLSGAVNELKSTTAPPMPTYRVGRQPQGTTLTTYQSGHGWVTAGTGGTSGLNETVGAISGSQYAWIQSSGAGNQYNLRRYGSAIGDTNYKAFRFRFKIDGISRLNELVFYAGKGNLATDDFKWSVLVGSGSTLIPDGEWGTMTLSFANAILEGSPLRHDCTDLQFQVWDNSGGTGAKLSVQSVELIPGTHDDFPNGCVSFTFDDTWLSPKTYAFNKMDSYGYPGTLYLIQDYIGQSNRLTLQDIKDRHNLYGWEIACHANTGTNHALSQTGMTAEQLEEDLRTQRVALEALGLRGSSGYAAPLGQWGKTVDAASTSDITRRYMSYLRTTAGRTTETLPPGNPYGLRAISAIGSFAGGASAASITAKITAAKKEGAWLIFVFHKIVTTTPADSGECTQTDFNTIVDAVAASGMPVLTVEDVIKTTSS